MLEIDKLIGKGNVKSFLDNQADHEYATCANAMVDAICNCHSLRASSALMVCSIIQKAFDFALAGLTIANFQAHIKC